MKIRQRWGLNLLGCMRNHNWMERRQTQGGQNGTNDSNGQVQAKQDEAVEPTSVISLDPSTSTTNAVVIQEVFVTTSTTQLAIVVAVSSSPSPVPQQDGGEQIVPAAISTPNPADQGRFASTILATSVEQAQPTSSMGCRTGTTTFVRRSG